MTVVEPILEQKQLTRQILSQRSWTCGCGPWRHYVQCCPWCSQ